MSGFTHSQIWRAFDLLAAQNGLTACGMARKAGLDGTSFNKSKRISAAGRERWPSTETLSAVLKATDTTMERFCELLAVVETNETREKRQADGAAVCGVLE